MNEILAVTSRLDHIAGRSVARSAGDTGPDGRPRRSVGRQDDVIDRAELLTRLADVDGAGDVGVVVLVRRAKVEDDSFALLNDAIGGHVVWRSGIRSAPNDQEAAWLESLVGH